jgi:hypothetical protein
MKRPWTLACTLFAALALGCGVEPSADDGSDTEELVAPNGVSLNGVSLNGVSLNGVSLNGVSLNGVSLNGVSLNGTQLTGVKTGQAVSGSAFVGTLWTGTLSNGSAMTLRIDSATTGAAPNTDVWMYGVSYQTSAGWAPLCGSSSVLTIPVKGTWNYGQGVVGGGSYTADATKVTFGCRGTAIAKCVEWGYKPWKTVGTTSLQNHHVACTRMVRGDYCGNGTPGTVNGTPIDIYDGLGIQLDTEGWDVDAEWTPAGARCVSKKKYTRATLSGEKIPVCLSALKTDTCGDVTHFATGTLLVDETML